MVIETISSILVMLGWVGIGFGIGYVVVTVVERIIKR